MDHPAQTSYDESFPDLRDVHLEGSWVLRLDPAEHSVVFTLEAVLTPAHGRYHRPNPGDQYCYERAVLSLTSRSPVAYQLTGALPAHDLSGSDDLGNIDTFRQSNSRSWELTGGWGLVTIVNPRVALTFQESST